MTANKNIGKILLIHQENHVGGGDTYVHGILNGLKELGVTSSLLEGRDVFGLIKKLYNSKEKYILWSIYDRFPLIPYVFSFLKGKKNVLIIYGIWKLESRALFRKYDDPEMLQAQKTRELKYLLRQWLFILFSSRVLHLSNYSKNLFEKQPLFRFFGKKKSAVIYGAADKNIFKKISNKDSANLRKNLGIAKNDIILLMVGRIEDRKNYTDGVEILKRLRKLMPDRNILLYVVLSYGGFNDYGYFDLMANKIARSDMGNYVRVITGIPNSKISELFQVADVYLMLSKELETFGLVTVESLQCGLPVFGYASCATPEIVENTSYKSLFQVGEIAELTHQIASYLRLNGVGKKNVYAKMSSNLNLFSWRKTSDKIIGIL